jgi:hypothetical protein
MCVCVLSRKTCMYMGFLITHHSQEPKSNVLFLPRILCNHMSLQRNKSNVRMLMSTCLGYYKAPDDHKWLSGTKSKVLIFIKELSRALR